MKAAAAGGGGWAAPARPEHLPASWLALPSLSHPCPSVACSLPGAPEGFWYSGEPHCLCVQPQLNVAGALHLKAGALRPHWSGSNGVICSLSVS